MQTQLINGLLPARAVKLARDYQIGSFQAFKLTIAFYSRLWAKPIAFTYYQCEVYIKKEGN